MNTSDEIPTPPQRLYDDRRMMHDNADTPAWEARRASKMRERFPMRNHEVVRGLGLTAPVQPSTPSHYRSGRPL